MVFGTIICEELKQFQNYISNFFKGHERSVKAKKQIIYSFFLKGISLVVGLILVPLILGYLDAERYGIWLTLSSILAWFSFFDIGLGNGLRNRLTEAIALKDNKLAKTYVSTTYAILGSFFLVLIFLFILLNQFLDWQIILNTKTIEKGELSIIALIIFIFFILSFFFKLIGTILMADQRPAINSFFSPIGNLIALVIIYILTKITSGSLLLLSLVLSSSPVLVLIVANFYFFYKDYKNYKPEFKCISLKKSRDLFALGFRFFYIQLGSILFFSTANFFIAQFSNQETVAAYNVAYNYLFLVNMMYAIILSPYWSAVKDAYVRKDFVWLKKQIAKLNKISIVMIILLILALIFSPIAYEFWIGKKLTIQFSLSFIITIFLIEQIIIAPYTAFINGFGRLKLNIYLQTFGIIIYLPMSYFFGSLWGVYGIVSSIIVLHFPWLFIEPIQVYKIINQKASGIWNE